MSRKDLSKEDRELIAKYRKEKYKLSRIAKILGVHQSTVFREIKRNRTNLNECKVKEDEYDAEIAQMKYVARRTKLRGQYKNS